MRDKMAGRSCEGAWRRDKLELERFFGLFGIRWACTAGMCWLIACIPCRVSAFAYIVGKLTLDVNLGTGFIGNFGARPVRTALKGYAT